MLLRLIQESEHGITRDELFAIFNVVGNRGGMQRVQNALVRLRKEGENLRPRRCIYGRLGWTA